MAAVVLLLHRTNPDAGRLARHGADWLLSRGHESGCRPLTLSWPGSSNWAVQRVIW